MRFLQALVFLVFLCAVLVFAFQNDQTVSVSFLQWGLTAPFALLAVTIYLLGMLSGWTVVSFIGRSIRRVTDRRKS